MGRWGNVLCKAGKSDSFTTNPGSSNLQHNQLHLEQTPSSSAPHILCWTPLRCAHTGVYLEARDPPHYKQSLGTAIWMFVATYTQNNNSPSHWSEARTRAQALSSLLAFHLCCQMEESSQGAKAMVEQPLKSQGTLFPLLLPWTPPVQIASPFPCYTVPWQHTSLYPEATSLPIPRAWHSSGWHLPLKLLWHTSIWTTTILPFSISIFIDFWGSHLWDVWYHWIIPFSNLFVSLFICWIDSFFYWVSKKDAATVVIWLSQQLT